VRRKTASQRRTPACGDAWGLSYHTLAIVMNACKPRSVRAIAWCHCTR
jgi:hypothetical protein